MREAVEAYAAKESIGPLHIPLDYTSYLHAAAALRSGACAADLPSVALNELTAELFTTWPLTPLKLERPPFSLFWCPRNASARPVVAALAESMSRILTF